jgi:hypothetical protein
MAVEEQASTGDLVRARVVRGGAEVLAALLPGAVGLVRRGDVPREADLRPGDVVTVRLLDLDARGERALLGLEADPPAPEDVRSLRLLPGGPEFLAAETAPHPEGDERGRLNRLALRLRRAEAEAEALREERDRLRDELGKLGNELRDARARIDRLADEVGDLRAGGPAEPAEDRGTPDERWERAVRAAYERLYRASDRDRYPLGRFAFLPGFAASADALHGVDEARIAEVCAHVAANRAHEINGLEVHPLRSGPGGAPQRVRADGARGWRAALQVGSAAARRLHYWVLSDPAGWSVEFEVVGTHDQHV